MRAFVILHRCRLRGHLCCPIQVCTTIIFSMSQFAFSNTHVGSSGNALCLVRKEKIAVPPVKNSWCANLQFRPLPRLVPASASFYIELPTCSWRTFSVDTRVSAMNVLNRSLLNPGQCVERRDTFNWARRAVERTQHVKRHSGRAASRTRHCLYLARRLRAILDLSMCEAPLHFVLFWTLTLDLMPNASIQFFVGLRQSTY